MQIQDLGDEAIREILEEATDGMRRRTGKAWGLELDGAHGILRMLCEGRYRCTSYVSPHLPPLLDGERDAPEAIRFRSAFRKLVLDVTQTITPVPGVSDVPAALVNTFNAIRSLDAADGRKDFSFLPAIRHDLHRILDHLTGCDHSGCSSKPSVADYGRVVALGREEAPKRKGIQLREVTTTTHADGSQTVRTREA